MANGDILRVNKVSKNFGGLVALSEVSFRVKQGEFLGLIGPNGAGKSVMVNLISGMYKPNKGNIEFDGLVITGMRPDRIIRMGLSRTFQHSTLFFDLTVRENIMMGVREIGDIGLAQAILQSAGARAKDQVIGQRAKEVMQLLELEGQAEEKAANLPYGLQKVVAIGIAIAPRPKVLILDEPLTGLVAAEVNQVMHHIAGLNRQGMTIFIIEHNMRAVMSYCARIMVLSFGNKIAEGTPSEIQKNPDVINSYLGK
ncbi:ABC transporter ATP-binding protein [Desulfoferula mesophila]|uniref:ABC transporter ATP-binding protein n=1 Tax=Desulfoferula mesophila TaxID=3058419 RepID=A0AAU9ES47_9BACT|nr:ABC transporter ATP-binding protein [Desulfoferula mesophilus]